MNSAVCELEHGELALDRVGLGTRSATSSSLAVARVTSAALAGLTPARFVALAVTLAAFAPS